MVSIFVVYFSLLSKLGSIFHKRNFFVIVVLFSICCQPCNSAISILLVCHFFSLSTLICAFVLFVEYSMHVLRLAWLYFITSKETSTCPSAFFFISFFFFISTIVSLITYAHVLAKSIWRIEERKFFRLSISTLRVALQKKTRQTVVVTKTWLSRSREYWKKIEQLK